MDVDDRALPVAGDRRHAAAAPMVMIAPQPPSARER
jgi:hypothetical protein